MSITVPSDIRIGSDVLCAILLAISLSSPVLPLPHHTCVCWGIEIMKQSLEFKLAAQKSTCK